MKKQPKKIFYDAESDSLSIVLRPGVEESFEEISPGISVELDEKGRIMGFEILNASQALKDVAEPLYQRVRVAA